MGMAPFRAKLEAVGVALGVVVASKVKRGVYALPGKRWPASLAWLGLGL